MRASEWLLLAACAGLLVVGPAMAFQEFARMERARAEAEEAAAREKLTQTPVERAAPDYAYRDAWRWPLFALVAIVGVAGSLTVVRVTRRRRLRAVSGRLLALLLLGMTLLDLAFLVDVRWAFGVPHAVRGWTLVWLYPAAALLVAGSVYRITELEPHFGSDAPPVPALRA